MPLGRVLRKPAASSEAKTGSSEAFVGSQNGFFGSHRLLRKRRRILQSGIVDCPEFHSLRLSPRAQGEKPPKRKCERLGKRVVIETAAPWPVSMYNTRRTTHVVSGCTCTTRDALHKSSRVVHVMSCATRDELARSSRVVHGTPVYNTGRFGFCGKHPIDKIQRI